MQKNENIFCNMAAILFRLQCVKTISINTLKPTQNGRHFADGILECIFLNVWILMKNFSEVCSWKSNWQYSSIGSDNGLALNRQQAIVWINDG